MAETPETVAKLKQQLKDSERGRKEAEWGLAGLRANLRTQLLLIQNVAEDPLSVRRIVCEMRDELDTQEFGINVEYAWKQQDVEMLEEWVIKGGSIERRNLEGRTFLLRAAEEGVSILVDFCLRHSCDVNACDIFGWNALHYATEQNMIHVAEKLIDANINVSMLSKQKMHRNQIKHPVGTSAMDIADLKQYTDMIDLLHRNRSYTAAEMMEAISKGEEQIVRRYIECRGDIEARDNDGRTPMIAAATSCQRTIMRLLLDASCNINARDTVYNGTALIGLVCFSKREQERREIGEDLVNAGIDINAVNKFGWSALHYAVEHNLETIVGLLTSHAACTKDIESTTKLTRKTIPHPPGTKPIHVASRRGHTHLLKYLPDCYSLKKVTEDEARTASELGDVNVLQHYVNGGGNLEILDKMGRTLLIRACAYGRDKVVKFCLENNCNSRALDQEYKGTAMISCTCNDNLEKPRLRICKLLVKAGVDVNGVNKYGWSALHYAVEHDLQSVVEFLVFDANHRLDIESVQQMTRKRIPHGIKTTACDIGMRRKNHECVQTIKAKKYIDMMFQMQLEPILYETLRDKRHLPPLIPKLISDYLRAMLRVKDVRDELDSFGQYFPFMTKPQRAWNGNVG